MFERTAMGGGCMGTILLVLLAVCVAEWLWSFVFPDSKMLSVMMAAATFFVASVFLGDTKTSESRREHYTMMMLCSFGSSVFCGLVSALYAVRGSLMSSASSGDDAMEFGIVALCMFCLGIVYVVMKAACSGR